MKAINFLMGCAATCLLAGCADEWVVNDPSQQNEGTPLTIRASNGSDADTRLAFDEDGLTLLWENGDQLVLVDVNDKIAPIYLTTELDKPSNTAVFKSESGVPAGKYYIRNYHSGYKTNYEDWMTLDLGYEYTNHYNDIYNLNNLSEVGKHAELYAGPITIEDGDTHIDVELKHMFTMLKFNITGIENIDPKMDVYIGMVSPQNPFPTKVWIDQENTQDQQSSTPHLQFNSYKAESGASGKGAFILPVDLTGKKVYFYVAASTTVFDREYEREIIYEIEKDGIELKAGTSYTINLDLSTATPVEINNLEISTAKQFRALAYNCRLGSGANNKRYKITEDIDFTGVNMFPITLNGIIEGQGHKLSNITIDWPYDNAGVFGYMAESYSISDLTLENITVKGKNYVGGLIGGGRASTNNCHLTGTNTIIGTGDYVGGLFGGTIGFYSGAIEDCSVSPETTVEGKTAVGGIAGHVDEILNCKSDATVKGESKVGGIAGIIKQEINESSSTANVTATGDYAGGVIGAIDDGYRDPVNQCSYEGGTVSGKNYVGGIVGASSRYSRGLDLCYSTGTVKGAAYVGGISGSRFSITNCYSLCTIEGTDQNTTAGIIGESFNETPQNCYFAGTLTNDGYGITGKGTVTNCLTTAATLSNADTEDDNKYKNLTSIVDMVTHINGEEAYSTSTIWEDFNYKCPKFQWQLSGVEFGDENGEVETPPFIKGEEW